MTHAIILAVLSAAVLLYGGFTIAYVATFPWRETLAGRALVASSSGSTLVFGGLLVDEWRNVSDPVWLAIGIIVIAGGVFKWVLLVRSWRSALSSQ